MHVYISYPAHTQPHVSGWTTPAGDNMQALNKHVFEEVVKAFEDAHIMNIKFNRRADASIGATMEIDGKLNVHVDGKSVTWANT